jgi:ADP-ribosylglycohydrolase
MINKVSAFRMRDAIRGMFAGVMIGDSLGMPVETMQREQIAQLNGGTGVTDYMDPVQRRVEDTRNMKRGDYTDDWQLTAVVADSLIRCRGYEGRDMALSHINAMKASTFGWGKGTMRSLQEIVDGKRNWDQPIIWNEPNKGCGNGVIMKVSPFAAMDFLKNSPSYASSKKIVSLAEITHPDKVAAIAASVVYRFRFKVWCRTIR